MKHPSNRVVDGLGLGEGLVSTLVCNDPQASAKQSGDEAVQGPNGYASRRAQEGVRQDIRGDELRYPARSLVGACDSNNIPEAVGVV